MPLECKGLHRVNVNANEKIENGMDREKDKKKEQVPRRQKMTSDIAFNFSRF